MEFVNGPSLQQLISLYQRLPENTALEVGRQVAEAFCHLELNNMVHRDMKPENIMLAGDVVKICDLGLAREIRSGSDSLIETNQGLVMGTPHYISPEQARGRTDLDIRTDLYGLGGILYRMVAGQLPFKADNPRGYLTKHLEEPLTPPEKHCPGLAPETSQLIQTLMAKERDDRFPSAQEALEVIEECLKNLGAPSEDPMTEAEVSADTQILRPVEMAQRKVSACDLKPTLIFTHGGDIGRREVLDADEIAIGRMSDCEVRVRQPWFSRRHFTIKRKGNRWILDDLESRNGTSVNGTRVMRCILQPGDEISVMSSRIAFVLEADQGSR